jgi:hypothetical protein
MISVREIQFIPLHPVSVRYILISSSHLGLNILSGLFRTGLPTKTTCECFPHACHMPCPSHPLLIDHSNYIWRRVQVMALLLMQFSSTLYYFILLRSKYAPPHYFMSYFQSVFSLQRHSKFPTDAKFQAEFSSPTVFNKARTLTAVTLLHGCLCHV